MSSNNDESFDKNNINNYSKNTKGLFISGVGLFILNLLVIIISYYLYHINKKYNKNHINWFIFLTFCSLILSLSSFIINITSAVIIQKEADTPSTSDITPRTVNIILGVISGVILIINLVIIFYNNEADKASLHIIDNITDSYKPPEPPKLKY